MGGTARASVGVRHCYAANCGKGQCTALDRDADFAALVKSPGQVLPKRRYSRRHTAGRTTASMSSFGPGPTERWGRHAQAHDVAPSPPPPILSFERPGLARVIKASVRSRNVWMRGVPHEKERGQVRFLSRNRSPGGSVRAWRAGGRAPTAATSTTSSIGRSAAAPASPSPPTTAPSRRSPARRGSGRRCAWSPTP